MHSTSVAWFTPPVAAPHHSQLCAEVTCSRRTCEDDGGALAEAVCLGTDVRVISFQQ